MNRSSGIVIMAGGTGGHVFPALAVADVLRARGHTVTWIGTRQGLEARIVPAAGIPMEWIDVGGVRGKGAGALFKTPFMLSRALMQALSVFRRVQPVAALGMGGFASGPGGVAARLAGCPLVVHEQNAVPGVTNRILSRMSRNVLEGFPGSFSAKRRARYVGNPVRSAIAGLPAPEQRFAGRSGPIRILVIGGSQGARVLNQNVPVAIARLGTAAVEVLHQTGIKDAEAVTTLYREHRIEARVTPFIDDMAAAYAWADLAVCRSGALTVAELSAAGLGALLVPFASAVDDHQTANARFLVEQGAALLLPQSSATPVVLAEALGDMVKERGLLLGMARNARSLARPDAADLVADVCLAAGGLP
ncbi:MAG TPA: undecaprenyldiphospho-muramoylpentapeptide beta-N-acetylglucosaminyltransferase [Gammaproteobacteria bacterium]|jgi:UDP-N-acetylglucosamine--N-acetylmuramyl-(pentapeptide) pyrophosphoryl-undecaprenol N-acetylglucosamine transferase|nr:undecaprenyldiphospho-muramoylpentapeptide beta-N-acetylglucosaminyltransferase [Gammaproteobacteria bacterium]